MKCGWLNQAYVESKKTGKLRKSGDPVVIFNVSLDACRALLLEASKLKYPDHAVLWKTEWCQMEECE